MNYFLINVRPSSLRAKRGNPGFVPHTPGLPRRKLLAKTTTPKLFKMKWLIGDDINFVYFFIFLKF